MLDDVLAPVFKLELKNTAELCELRRLLDRALGCLPPEKWPAWVKKLDADVDAALKRTGAM